jgi:hypothetical protein
MASPRAPITAAYGFSRAATWAGNDLALEAAEAREARSRSGSSVTTSAPRPPERPGLFTLVPTAATVVAFVVALALLLDGSAQAGRGRVAQPSVRGVSRPATSESDDFLWYVVDTPAKGKLLQEALAVSQGGTVHGEVQVVGGPEEQAVLERALRDLNNARENLGLPDARMVDLRDQ